jgi:hypothetical protein
VLLRNTKSKTAELLQQRAEELLAVQEKIHDQQKVVRKAEEVLAELQKQQKIVKDAKKLLDDFIKERVKVEKVCALLKEVEEEQVEDNDGIEDF